MDKEKPFYDVDRLTNEEIKKKVLTGQLLKRMARLLKVDQIQRALKQEFPGYDLQKVAPWALISWIVEIILNMVEGPELDSWKSKWEQATKDRIPDIEKASYEEINEYLNRSIGRTNRLTLEVFDLVLALDKAKKLKVNFNKTTWPETWPPRPADKVDGLSFLQVGSMKQYYEFTRLLSAGRFKRKEGKSWPSAPFDTVKGEVYLKPLEADRKPIIGDNLAHFQDLMQSKVMELEKHGHLTADIFDILVNKWLKVARTPEAMIRISINDFLEIRGLKPMKRGEDRRSGYTDAQRQQIAQQIDLLDNVYITITELDVYPKGQKKKSVRGLSGRSIIKDMEAGQMDLAGNVKADEWYLRPGTIFANYFFEPYGRQTALLSLKAVQYDPDKQKREKSLTRYLAYIWRIDTGRTREGLLVSKLLEAAGEEMNISRPGRTKERLEKALDQLKDDEVIAGWRYDKNIKLEGRGWWQKWLEQKITLSAPEEILEHYKQIKGK